jgi:hypothetical protein
MLLAQVALWLMLTAVAYAQSSDVRFPTPVGSSEVEGAIAARDIGDPRLTDHFYTFNAVPGDLYITIESRNLNGDLDIFTAAELRPLLKISVYAGTTSSVTKNLYLRKRESLILRVEARTPNDDDGIYHIRFSGSFEPISGLTAEGEQPTTEAGKQPARSSDKKVTRVSSVGARIEASEVATAPTPEPTPEATPKTEAEKPGIRAKSQETEKKERVAETSQPANVTPPVESKSQPTEAAEAPAKTRATRRTTARRRAPRTAPPTPATEAQPESTQRLVIERNDGTRIEHLMSSVRRIMIENGQIVIVRIDGGVERVPMVSVARMSIGP